MLSTVREVERKYEVTDGVSLPSWTGVVPGAEVVTADQDLAARYFDTGDLRLARDGLTLRWRREDGETGWQLKVPAGQDARDEIRHPGQRPTRPPAQLRDLVRSVTRGADLLEVADLRTKRRLLVLRDADGQDIVAVTDDRVTARVRGGDGATLTWREIEVELGPNGGQNVLERMESMLGSAGLRPSSWESKLHRALGEGISAAAPATPPGRRATAGTTVLAYLAGQAHAVRAMDRQVRLDAPDAVHQMRVATRRLRSTLQAYRSVLPRERTRALTDELKWLAGVLGDDRDLEVLRARITDAVAAEPAELVLGPVQARISAYFADRQATARAAVLAALDGERYLALLQALDNLLAEPPLTPAARRPGSRVCAKALHRAHRRVERHLAAADRLTGTERDAELHEARKAAKRLRYAAEVAEPVLGKPARRLVKRCKSFQDLLGEHQDAVVAAPVLRELAVGAHLAGENGFTFGLIAGGDRRTVIDRSGVDEHRRRLSRASRKAAG